MAECIFCQIAAGEADAEIVHEDDDVIAFRDINPSAPIHFLVIPRTHHPNFDSLSDGGVQAKLIETAKRLGQEHSGDLGYRIAVNSDKLAEVNHLHFHVLGGRSREELLEGGDRA